MARRAVEETRQWIACGGVCEHLQNLLDLLHIGVREVWSLLVNLLFRVSSSTILVVKITIKLKCESELFKIGRWQV